MRRPLILLAEDQPEALHFFQLFPDHAFNVVAMVRDERALLTDSLCKSADENVLCMDHLRLVLFLL